MSEVSDEIDRILAILKDFEYNINYNDNSGINVRTLDYRLELPKNDVDGGGVDPFLAIKEYVLPLAEQDHLTALADNPKQPVFTTEGVDWVTPYNGFVVHSATLYRYENALNDSYEYWLELIV